MIRLGLCCKFYETPIKFSTTTAKYLSTLSVNDRKNKISKLCLDNSKALLKSLEYCNSNGIGSFRINSKILPLKTHPEFNYNLKDLADYEEIFKTFKACRTYASNNDIRMTFHPDQFILLSSENADVTQRSIEELRYQAMLSDLIGADVINIHGGGAYGDKETALKRVEMNILKLDQTVRSKLTIENDDRIYSPQDLLPLCEKLQIPFVYDVHHHRCLNDNLSIEEVTRRALKTWDREPLFHISSPKYGWKSNKPGPHHDYIDINDFPDCWKKLDLTVEVEAKAKELAVKKLINDLVL